MQKFFIKKEAFFICFFSCLIIFFLVNIVNVESMSYIVGKAREELSKKDIWVSGNIHYSVENIVKEEALKKVNLKEVHGLFYKLLGKKEFGNLSYIKGKDKMMYYGSLIQGQTETLTYAKRVKKAMEEGGKKDAKTLFVMLPSKIIYGLSDIKGEFLLNDKNAIQDDLLLSMQYCEVPTLDLRNAMLSSGLPVQQLFYKTENTWTIEAAFIAATAIVKDIRDKYGDDWDPDGYYSDLDHYERVVYKESTTGTFGRNAGVIYSGRDDFSILSPKFHTMMEWYDLEKNEKIEGDFQETLITLDLEEKEGVYANPGNDLYLSGIVGRDRIVNKNNPNGPKILCLRDGSFSAVASFLAPMCSQVDMVYARRERNNLDYERLILEEDYDYLIIVTNPYNIDEANFDYFKE